MEQAKIENLSWLSHYAFNGNLKESILSNVVESSKEEVARRVCYLANIKHIDVKNTVIYQATNHLFNWDEGSFTNNKEKLLEKYSEEEISLLGLFYWEFNEK